MKNVPPQMLNDLYTLPMVHVFYPSGKYWDNAP
jgi:hypothetical protein